MRTIIEDGVPIEAGGYKISELSSWQKAALAKDLFTFAYNLLHKIEEEPENVAYSVLTEVISERG